MYNKSKNKKTSFYTALAKAPGLLKEYIKQYTQGQVDFPDELIEAFTQAQGDIKKIEQMCNNLKKSKEGAQIMKVAEQVYNAAQQEIDAEVNNSAGLFKDGGKFQYLRKLQDGKNVPKIKRHEFDSDTLQLTPGYRIISQHFYPVYEYPDSGKEFSYDFDASRGRVLYDSPTGRQEVYFNYPDNYISCDHGYMPIGTTKDQESAKKRFYQFLDWADPKNPDVQKVKAEKHDRGGIIRKGLKWLLGKSDDVTRTKAARIPSENFSTKPTDFDIDKVYMNPAMIAQPKRIPNSNIDNIRYKGSPVEIPTYELPTIKISDDLQKWLDDVKSGKIKLTK